MTPAAKTCVDCACVGEPSEFKGRRCKPCARAANHLAVQRWKQANPDKVLAHKRATWNRYKDDLNAARRTPERRERANARRREAYQRDPARFRQPYSQKKRARWDVWKAIKDGKLTRGSCVECGAENAQAHHHDYSKPLDVTWLCARCHAAVHRGAVV